MSANNLVGIISDTHEELDDNIRAVIKGCDIAIHAGDIGTSSVLEAMQPKTAHVIAVAVDSPSFGILVPLSAIY